ncbi:MAG: hypothetical protein LBQ77_00035 [Treponema sp.]|jgi:vacuolar-type H+-ATPase subunit H|nr:hypothetical protein [Treponema sp.]
MNEQETLQHLLQVESEAGALITAAQAEAERRHLEHETKERTLHEERYSQAAAELETTFKQEFQAIKAECEKQLVLYQQELDSLKVNQETFDACMKRFLFGI